MRKNCVILLKTRSAEQIEEEALARTLNDKLEMIGDEKSGLYLFDKDILNVSVEEESPEM